MKLWVGIRVGFENEIAGLENFGNENAALPFMGKHTTKFGNAAVPRARQGTKKNVYGFLHTRSSGRANARPFFNAGRAAFGVPRVLTHA